MGQETATTDDGIQGYLKATISRAQLLTTAGVGLALAAVPNAAAAASRVGSGSAQQLSFPFFPQVQGTYTPENVLDILNLLETFEMYTVTIVTNALTNPAVHYTEPWLSQRQSMAAIGQYHIDFLESLGAHSLLTTFTPRNKPPTTNPVGTQETDISLLIAAYMTAVREFAELSQPLLAKNAFQIGATWAEVRAVIRALSAASGSATAFTPAHNKAFETDHFVYTRDLYKFRIEGKQFENSGVSLSGLHLTYQGRAAVLDAAGQMAVAVIQKTPNNAVVSTSGNDQRAKGDIAQTGERGDTP